MKICTFFFSRKDLHQILAREAYLYEIIWNYNQKFQVYLQGCCVFKIIGLQTHASCLISAWNASKKTQKTQNFLKHYFSNANQRKISFWPDFVSFCGSPSVSFVKSDGSGSKLPTNQINHQKYCWKYSCFLFSLYWRSFDLEKNEHLISEYRSILRIKSE